MSTLRERIEQILKLRGWSERDWAEAAGLSSSHVNKIKSREAARPSPKTLAKLATSAKISYEWLANGTGVREVPDGLGRIAETMDSIRGDLAREQELRRTAEIEVATLRERIATLESDRRVFLARALKKGTRVTAEAANLTKEQADVQAAPPPGESPKWPARSTRTEVPPSPSKARRASSTRRSRNTR